MYFGSMSEAYLCNIFLSALHQFTAKDYNYNLCKTSAQNPQRIRISKGWIFRCLFGFMDKKEPVGQSAMLSCHPWFPGSEGGDPVKQSPLSTPLLLWRWAQEQEWESLNQKVELLVAEKTRIWKPTTESIDSPGFCGHSKPRLRGQMAKFSLSFFLLSQSKRDKEIERSSEAPQLILFIPF